mmetsp:Transcript_36393/g.53314  ORF Transcript_36393/g.53314 Transcript_36393/m.53314 type:complete len:524 (-) Transcript_36393:179-1750(-)
MVQTCERKKDFKKGIDTGDSRRRRGETTVSLRKAKKEEGLAKRRNVRVNNFVSEDPQPQGGGNSKKTYTISDIPALRTGIQSSDLAVLIESTRGFRRLLSVETNPPVQDVLAAGVLDTLISLLGRTDSSELQFEAAWALTNIASTEHTAVVVEHGAVPGLVALLTHAKGDLREQSAWCLGNIAGDCTEFRDLILQAGGLNPLLMNIAQPESLTLLRNVTWALSNFCRGKPQPDLETVRPAIPALASLLTHTDQETVVDACWALSYLSDGEDDRIQACVDGGVVPHLVNLLSNPSSQVITPALRTLGNIVTGNDVQTQSVIDAGILAVSPALLSNAKKTIRKEACWMLSNIAAGTAPQISALLAAPNVIGHAIGQLAQGEWDVRKEACWVVSNVATGGTWEHARVLVDQGCLEPICDLLGVSDSKIILVALDALEALLRKADAHDQAVEWVTLVDEADGIEKIEALQEHEHEEVYEKAVAVLEEFFAAEDEEEDENLAPNAAAGDGGFQFGVAPPAGGQLSFAF